MKKALLLALTLISAMPQLTHTHHRNNKDVAQNIAIVLGAAVVVAGVAKGGQYCYNLYNKQPEPATQIVQETKPAPTNDSTQDNNNNQQQTQSQQVKENENNNAHNKVDKEALLEEKRKQQETILEQKRKQQQVASQQKKEQEDQEQRQQLNIKENQEKRAFEIRKMLNNQLSNQSPF